MLSLHTTFCYIKYIKHTQDSPKSTEIEIKYDEDIPDKEHSEQAPTEEKTNTNKTGPATAPQTKQQQMDADLMKYMDNPLRSPLCQFVMEFVYSLGDISHASEESAPIIRKAIIIVLEAYIKILKADDTDVGGGGMGGIGDEYGFGEQMGLGHVQGIGHHNNNSSSHHSFYIIVPIIWGILNAIKEDVSVNMDRKSALSISKCVDTLSKYNKNNAFSTLWKSEWDILSTGVRASLLAYFLPGEGPIEKPPKKFFDPKIIKDYFKISMDIIGVKKSPSSIEVREQHMRLATICAIYEKSLREKLEKTIRDILTFHISKYIKSSFNVYKISPSKQNKGITKGKKGHGHHHNNCFSSSISSAPKPRGVASCSLVSFAIRLFISLLIASCVAARSSIYFNSH